MVFEWRQIQESVLALARKCPARPLRFQIHRHSRKFFGYVSATYPVLMNDSQMSTREWAMFLSASVRSGGKGPGKMRLMSSECAGPKNISLYIRSTVRNQDPPKRLA